MGERQQAMQAWASAGAACAPQPAGAGGSQPKPSIAPSTSVAMPLSPLGLLSLPDDVLCRIPGELGFEER